MQERKKRRIVIASVLKPVDDTRMFEKMGQSLSTDYEVHIIGFPTKSQQQYPGISFHPSTSFSRISLSRMLAPWNILLKLFTIRPVVLIIATHELLVIAALSKLLLRTKIIYDVRENYGRNIMHTNAFPFSMRAPLAAYVRIKEWLTAPLISFFLLAEKAYVDELNFPASRTTVIENKYKRTSPIPARKNAGESIRLLFSGTLAESTGIFTAIKVATRLHERNSKVSLTIIGYCALADTRRKIKMAIAERPFIHLKGGDQLVPHADILREIQQADAGIISYPPNPSTQNSIPTKLYEYLGNQLPILLINHQPWVKMCAPYPAAIPFDIDTFDAAKILSRLNQGGFYTLTPTDILWETEETKLLALVSKL